MVNTLKILDGAQVLGDTSATADYILENADLLIAESYFYEKDIKYHLNYRTLMDQLPVLNPGKLLLTHMGQEMLDRLAEIHTEAAYDGLEIGI